MSALILNDAKGQAKTIATFAAKPENWYKVGESNWIPGDRKEFVLVSLTIRAVFTWTQVKPEDVHRHMTISTMGPSYPSPLVVWTVAHMFGFTGAKVDEQGLVHEPAKTWAFLPNKDEQCIAVTEKIEPTPRPEVTMN